MDDSNLYHHLEDCLYGQDYPPELLKKTLTNGVLFKLGEWFFEDYFNVDYDDLGNIIAHIVNLNEGDKIFYLEDFYDMLVFHEVDTSTPILKNLDKLLNFFSKHTLIQGPTCWKKMHDFL